MTNQPNPGRVASIHTQEIDVIDRSIPDQLGWVLTCFLSMTLSVLAIGKAVSLKLFFPIGILCYYYGKIMGAFRPASRDLKQSESVTRAPIIGNFKELMSGVTVIRSMSSTPPTWIAHNRNLVEKNLGCVVTLKALDRWLSIRLEIMGNLIVFSAAIAASVLSKKGSGLTSGAAGWGITQALAITGLLNWAVRCVTESETQMLSLQRTQEIGKMIDENNFRERSQGGEQNGNIVGNDGPLLASGWPWSGKIEMINVSVRYGGTNASAPVLKNLNLAIEGGSSLGIVGRTGSGKSSLLLALFRLLEIDSNLEGSNDSTILIDGIDIRSIQMER